MNCIVSSIPGRLRLRHPALRTSDRLSRLIEGVRTWPGVRTALANPRTGSLLLTYDPAVLSEADSHRRAASAIADLMPAEIAPPPVSEASRPVPRARLTAARANRVAKPFMLASLVTSLALAAAGAKRGHILAGVGFLHGLGVHLWVQRRNFFR